MSSSPDATAHGFARATARRLERVPAHGLAVGSAQRATPGASSCAVPVPQQQPWPVVDAEIVLRDIVLESGARIAQVSVRYRLEGALSAARDNLVLVVHSLTGDTKASRWWSGVIGERSSIDPTRHAILCADLTVGGSRMTGMADGTTPRTHRERFTTRDHATVLALLLDALGVQVPLLVCGGSLGGMVALEFAVSFPGRVKKAVVLAAPAAQTAQGIAWNAIMRRALEIGGDHDGLALARMVGMLSYRSAEGIERRFGRAADHDGRFLVEEWLAMHGEKLVSRFDARSYRALIDTMDTHDVGRGRGGICAAMAPVRDRIVGVGIIGDQLYPSDCVREWTQLAGATYEEITSPHGHDAFLLETSRVSAIVRKAIAPLAGTGQIARVARVVPTVRPLRIALAGCGTVGSALLELLVQHADTLGQPIRVVRVLVRDRSRPRPALVAAAQGGLADSAQCITDASRLLDDDIDVLFEALGGTTTAATLVEGALRRGIRVVTANKALLAERGASLAALAALNDTRFDFEGAVAGAVPVVRCIRSGAAGVGVTRFAGILNGTSNFVLERVAGGESLAEAIALAQRLGYAERDPSRDLSGEDAEDKLRVLAWLAFGVDPSRLRVVRRGLDAETAAWAARVAAAGDRVKLLATCARDSDGSITARVIPTRVTADDPWAQVAGAANRIVVESASAGALVFHGAGAGGRATAGAMMSDLFSVRALA